MHNKDFRERMWRLTKWRTSRFHENACLGLCMCFIYELCVDCWISIVHYFFSFRNFRMFGVFGVLLFCWVVINEFGSLIFQVFELCYFVIREFGVLQWASMKSKCFNIESVDPDNSTLKTLHCVCVFFLKFVEIFSCI
jgi:hypothetical protein